MSQVDATSEVSVEKEAKKGSPAECGEGGQGSREAAPDLGRLQRHPAWDPLPDLPSLPLKP